MSARDDRERSMWMTGEEFYLYLEAIAKVFGYARIRKYKRDWRFLWLRWCQETDKEFRNRVLMGVMRRNTA